MDSLIPGRPSFSNRPPGAGKASVEIRRGSNPSRSSKFQVIRFSGERPSRNTVSYELFEKAAKKTSTRPESSKFEKAFHSKNNNGTFQLLKLLSHQFIRYSVRMFLAFFTIILNVTTIFYCLVNTLYIYLLIRLCIEITTPSFHKMIARFFMFL